MNATASTNGRHRLSLDSTETGSQGPKFRFMTAAEFDEADYRRDYLIPHVLAGGDVPTLISGAFKTLKTSILMDIAISLATATPFLEKFEVPAKRRIALMSGESGGHALQKLARRVAHSKGFPFHELGEHFRIEIGSPDLTRDEDIAEIEKFISENGIEFFAVDPAYFALRGLESDSPGNLFKMANLLEPLARLSERTSCVFALVHHNNRTSMKHYEPPELSDVAWSGFSEWAGQWVLLSRREAFDPSQNGEHKLWLNAGGRDGHSQLVGVNIREGREEDAHGRQWSVECVSANDARTVAREYRERVKLAEQDRKKEQKHEHNKAAILRAMVEMNQTDTQRAIRTRSGVGVDGFDRAFSELLREGAVVPGGQITKGNKQTYDAYKLAD